jgi:hypothetical protein
LLYDKEDAERDTYAYRPTPRYVPWGPDTTLVQVPLPLLKAAGWKKVRERPLRLSVKSYLDTETGEIIKKRDMFKRRLPVPQNTSLRFTEQLSIINTQLNKRARDLCIFLLKMRNNRGSFVLPLSELIDGYINRNGPVSRMARARKQHSELIGEIAAAGIIAQEQALGSLFQKHAPMTAQDVLEESAVYYAWPGIFRGKSVWAS